MQRHESGPLHQHNKKFKSKHSSKGEIKRQAQGRVERVSVRSVNMSAASKAERRAAATAKKQNARDNARLECIAPRMIAVIALSPVEEPLCNDALQLLLEASGVKNPQEIVANSSSKPITVFSQQHKQRITFMNVRSTIDAILDAAKAAEQVVFVVSSEIAFDGPDTEEFQAMTDHRLLTLACLLAQGSPAPTVCIRGLSKLAPKKQTEAKNSIAEQFGQHYSEAPKVLPLDDSQEAVLALRHLCVSKTHIPTWRQGIPTVLVDNITTSETNGIKKTNLSGYLRGGSMDVNGLVHLTGIGSFQISEILGAIDPCPTNPRRARPEKTGDVEMGESQSEVVPVLAKSDPEKQEPLISENIPDPLEGEQTWPTQEEIDEAESIVEEKKKKKLVPKGTSAYQASWIIDEEEEGSGSDGMESGEEEGSGDEINPKVQESEGEEEEEDEMVEAPSEDDEKEHAEKRGVKWDLENNGEEMNEEEDEDEDEDNEDGLDEKWKLERENREFPDEVDTPTDTPARVRFQKYRGLKSFRTSPWDTKENLPIDYARIFQFKNYHRVKKHVLSEIAKHQLEWVREGKYITVSIAGFPQDFSFDWSAPLVLGGLRQHENKKSVVHALVEKHSSFEEPIKAKDTLLAYMGLRKFNAAPIYSHHSIMATKHKLERFMPDGTVCASFYGPIAYTPCPILFFKESTKDGKKTMQLAATGYIYNVDPDRIICKKIIISGFPFKIHKNIVTVRGMFLSPADINWFKPVELWTKCGRTGTIIEPLGTHGHMKCEFDEQIKQNDTVCMSLYKRAFPKWV
eukprot:TRINITY_DN847_c3_g1_i1.p1 TRINITY_DN847_c3_g1~~TRINITY_DN847_c3_g1_i1.p1  ORF type:complete len:797 (-),score=279.95 TRINITY_DN847_c3_g1_i1:47-2437(-)